MDTTKKLLNFSKTKVKELVESKITITIVEESTDLINSENKKEVKYI